MVAIRTWIITVFVRFKFFFYSIFFNNLAPVLNNCFNSLITANLAWLAGSVSIIDFVLTVLIRLISMSFVDCKFLFIKKKVAMRRNSEYDLTLFWLINRPIFIFRGYETYMIILLSFFAFGMIIYYILDILLYLQIRLCGRGIVAHLYRNYPM